MDIPAALLKHLAGLASSIGLDPDFLHRPLTTLATDLRAAVPSYRGLQVIVVQNGQTVTLTDLLPSEADGAVLTSVRVPLSLLGPDHDEDSRVILYAGTPGAFVDLAADLGCALRASTMTIQPDGDQADSDIGYPVRASHDQVLRRLVLDGDLQPSIEVSGLTGLAKLSAVNRAVGILIDRGHTPDAAYAILRRAAASAGVETHTFAARMLGR